MAGLAFQVDSLSGRTLLLPDQHHQHHRHRQGRRTVKHNQLLCFSTRKAGLPRSQQQQAGTRSTKLVTFIGKGGSGKTISALLAAQYYARMGLRTCLVVQSQEPTVDLLLGQRIGASPTSFVEGTLDVVRLETTKLLLDPLAQIKKADARLNFSQGALDEIVGEEISVLPGMDALLALGAMERYIGFAGDILRSKTANLLYDIVVFDGASTEETLRLLGAAEKCRWYLQRARSLAEKTDTGRVTSPSILRLFEASLTQETGSDNASRTVAELWDGADKVFEKIAQTFADARRFSCYLVMDLSNDLSINAALRYWGCAMQSGVRVAGAFCAKAASRSLEDQSTREKFAPLSISSLPSVPLNPPVNWEEVVTSLDDNAKSVLLIKSQDNMPEPVTFNLKEGTVTFFLPGFQKSEIKLSQWRGGSALLMEVGDQRRVVNLPPGLRGKVGGAKFEEKCLTVTMKAR